MITINEIQEYCVQFDLNNLSSQLTEDDIRSFYDNASLWCLLDIYSSYMGLSDYKKNNPQDYKNTYGLDILTLLEEPK